MKLSGSESRPQTTPARGTLLKKLIALVAMMLMIGGANAALADPPDGKGPGDNNKRGLCTAYFNGQKNGHDDDEDGSRQKPFAGLEEAGKAYADNDEKDNDGDGEVDEGDEGDGMSFEEAVFNYCDGSIGGNPDHGRFLCAFGEDDPDTDEDESEQTECSDTEQPGKSDDK